MPSMHSILLAGGHCRRTAQLDGLVTHELPSMAHERQYVEVIHSWLLAGLRRAHVLRAARHRGYYMVPSVTAFVRFAPGEG